jgi:hypothetical protein
VGEINLTPAPAMDGGKRSARRLLRSRRERPRSGAAEKRHELAPPHVIEMH